MSERIKFTKTVLASITPPATGRAFYYDTTQSGLALQVTPSGVKSFQLYRKVGGKPVRVTLGRFPDMTVLAAQKKAATHMAVMVNGINPNAKKKEDAKAMITLKAVFADYLEARKSLKPGTVKDYRRLLEVEAFSDRLDLPLKSLSRDKVEQRHTELGQHSQARANNALRVLRALFNFAIGRYENDKGEALFSDNPVKRISNNKGWYQVDRRKTVIKVSDLGTWFHAVQSLTEQDGAQALTVKDYLLLNTFAKIKK